MTKKKKIIIGVAAVILLVIIATIFFVIRNNSDSENKDAIFVQKVSDIIGETSAGNRYSGVVESQKTIEFKKTSDKPIEKVFVKEGDAVEVNTPLYKVNVAQSENDISNANLSIESLNNEISVLRSAEQTTENQLQIEEKNLEIRQKQVEIAKLQREINQATIKSSLKGVVKTVNTNGTDAAGKEAPIITITETGDFRIKGKISEQSINSLSTGMRVRVKSRTDEETVWTGSITSVEKEPVSQNQDGGASGVAGADTSGQDSNAPQKASSYPFFITLDKTDGLMLGQHVFIEIIPADKEKEKSGLWIDQGFFIKDKKSKSFVWASKNGKLEKKEVILGDTDDETATVQIKKGLKKSDLIAWPDDTLKEGMKVSEVMENSKND